MAKGLSTGQAVLLGCGGALLLMALVTGLLVAGLVHISTEPKDVDIHIDGPTDVLAGESFTLSVTITNERKRKAFALTDLDLGTDYLDHFVVVGTDPEPLSTRDNAPFDASRSFTHNLRIPPGESRRFDFVLRADHEGLYRGDLDVCEGMRFITRMLQTSVKASDP
jgi:hypothetical protein